MFRPLSELPASAKDSTREDAALRLQERGVLIEDEGPERLLLRADATSLSPGVRKGCTIGGGVLAIFSLCVLVPLFLTALRSPVFTLVFELLFCIPFFILLVLGSALAAFANRGRGELLLTPTKASTLLGLGRWSLRRELPTAEIDQVVVSQMASKSDNPRTKAPPAKSTLVVCQLAAGSRKLVVPIAVDEQAAGWCYVLLQAKLREMGRPV